MLDTTRTFETREAVFRRALTLMSNRCTSVGQLNTEPGAVSAALIGVPDTSFGVHLPEFFYIQQKKPSPMAPLKAWRGYNGNVYFEPISIKSVHISGGNVVPLSNAMVKYDPLLSVNKLDTTRSISTPPSRSNTRHSARSSARKRITGLHQVTQLNSVMNNYTTHIAEDVTWITSRDNMGSLALRPQSSVHDQKMAMYNRDKIVKGSVVQRIREQKLNPNFTVSGDKFTPAHIMSPLLRTQTQYSHSSQRTNMNSPDPHYSGYGHLPPLEQIRASLRHRDHMDSMSEPSSYSRSSPYGRKVTMTEELKPFIKYSPDIRKKYLRQAQYLK